jgi:1-acyl-sn-glycerol-3-phosphate acyltransferase
MRYLYALYVVITFAVLFLAFFPLFLIFSFFRDWGKSIIFYLIKIWGYIWFFLVALPVRRIFVQKPRKNHTYIVVANHISYLDTAMIFRVMPFMVRPLAKREIAKVPLFGYLYRQVAVLIDREDEKSKAKGVRLLKKTLDKGISIFIFPEGTFNESEKPLKHFYDGAFRIALQTGTPILPVIFPDTVKRFHYSSFWKWSPGICRAIFLPEISVERFDKTDIAGLKSAVKAVMEEGLQKENERL